MSAASDDPGSARRPCVLATAADILDVPEEMSVGAFAVTLDVAKKAQYLVFGGAECRRRFRVERQEAQQRRAHLRWAERKAERHEREGRCRRFMVEERQRAADARERRCTRA